ncbi:hypothetical protein [Thiobacillus sp.]|uniref:hypothetical protein n=1 Tax=Thiobacillus sp. TaxID=924 RepID=UPI001ACB6095|nr:hypothetical protein [Thiobacillus sp.]MBN8780782.1 hypothetical protein [Thiobacillus sp.]
MTSEPQASRKGWGCLLAIIIAVFAVPAALLLPILVPRTLADWSIAPMCKADGGIRVFEKIQLGPGKFAVPEETNWAQYNEGRRILDDYRIIKSHAFSKPYGAAVYKYTTWIERISDKKRLSEMTQYFREGDEMFHGKHCPGDITEKTLIDRTFMPTGTFDPKKPSSCRNVKAPHTTYLDSSPVLPPKKLTGVFPKIENPLWKQQYACTGKMESHPTYSEVGVGEIALTGTAIFFDSEEGNRCSVSAMASPDRILCSDDAIWLLGRKSRSQKDNLTIQKYSLHGDLISEVTLKGSAMSGGRIIGFYQDSGEIAIEFLSFVGNQGEALCHRFSAKVPESIFGKKDGDQEEAIKLFAKWLPGCASL